MKEQTFSKDFNRGFYQAAGAAAFLLLARWGYCYLKGCNKKKALPPITQASLAGSKECSNLY